MKAISPQTGAPELVIAKDQPEYMPLPAAVYQDPAGSVVVLTRWSFSDEERERIAAGEDLYLGVMTFGKPLQPLMVDVGPDNWLPPEPKLIDAPATCGRCDARYGATTAQISDRCHCGGTLVPTPDAEVPS